MKVIFRGILLFTIWYYSFIYVLSLCSKNSFFLFYDLNLWFLFFLAFFFLEDFNKNNKK